MRRVPASRRQATTWSNPAAVATVSRIASGIPRASAQISVAWTERVMQLLSWSRDLTSEYQSIPATRSRLTCIEAGNILPRHAEERRAPSVVPGRLPHPLAEGPRRARRSDRGRPAEARRAPAVGARALRLTRRQPGHRAARARGARRGGAGGGGRGIRMVRLLRPGQRAAERAHELQRHGRGPWAARVVAPVGGRRPPRDARRGRAACDGAG